MKSINLKSLIQAKENMESEQFEKFKKYLGFNLSEREYNDLSTLTELLEISDYGGFYFGYTIPQISKEFDVLRFGEEYIINLELKSSSTKEKSIKQLQKNRYYLQPLRQKKYYFMFVSNQKKLYQLKKDELIEIEFEQLKELCDNQQTIEVDLNKIFLPKNYLVSPFNHSDKFLRNQYFLTNQQKEISNNLKRFITSQSECFASLQGAAGTGKTLVIYDLAKEIQDSNLKSAIIHCGNLNQGQKEINDSNKMKIFPAKEFKTVIDNQYEVIIIDEAQRMRKDQIEKICQYIEENNCKCIFSYDKKQYLSELEKNNHEYIQEKTQGKNIYKLSNKIRTNEEISNFIDNLFYSRFSSNKKEIENVTLVYFNDANDVKTELKNLKTKGWDVIQYTSSNYYYIEFEKYQCKEASELNPHKVIGQEFDNVVVVIDKNFYLENNMLCVRKNKKLPYCMVGMLYQSITRVRENLKVIILQNPEVLEKSLKILGGNISKKEMKV